MSDDRLRVGRVAGAGEMAGVAIGAAAMRASHTRSAEPVRICLVGATGLIGNAVMAQASRRADVHVVGVGRSAAGLPAVDGLEMLVGEPIDWPALIRSTGASVLVCALGTTIRAAGSEAHFRAIDHELVRFCAEGAKDAGIEHMILVSSVGADRGAGAFYLRVKGETEAALARLGFDRLDCLRPSLLRGRRRERRPLERIGQLLAPLADWLVLHGRWRRYRSITARDMARAILTLAHEDGKGAFIHEHDALIDLPAIRCTAGSNLRAGAAPAPASGAGCGGSPAALPWRICPDGRVAAARIWG